MSVPENKMMLAIYLTAPEIENDRRGLNTFYGMRRARKEGRWPGLAPVGYVNLTSENGRKYIAPDGEQAKIMEWAFKEIAKGKYSSEQIFNKAVENGLICSKNNFLRCIRNPIYCGDIFVPKYKDEEAQLVKGLHEPIISGSLFFDLQDVLDGKKRTIKTKIFSDEKLPLKGFLACSRCERALCGSASKGRNNYYYYYHCSSKCGCRYKAEVVNKQFTQFLDDHSLNAKTAELFKMVILDEYASDTLEDREYKTYMAKQLTENNNKLTRARELLLLGDIDGNDYKTLKLECEENITRTEAKLEEIKKKKYTIAQLEPILNDAIFTLTQLFPIFTKSAINDKRRLIGSMFPEKFDFESLQHRTALLSETFQCIFLINNKLECKKKRGQKTVKNLLPRYGRLMVLESF